MNYTKALKAEVETLRVRVKELEALTQPSLLNATTKPIMPTGGTGSPDVKTNWNESQGLERNGF